MSKKKTTIIMGAINIAVYIANIILVCIKGATLFSCIAGWSVAVLYTGLATYLLKQSL